MSSRARSVNGGDLQNSHVHLVGDFLRVCRSQNVPRHAKTAGRKHLFAILIAGERTRFSYQRINNVSVVNGRLILADDSRHRLNQMTMMSHRDLFGSDAKINKLANQSTWHRVRVGPHIDRAAATHANPLDDVVGVEHRVGQRPEMGGVIEKLLSTIRVGSFDQIFHEGNILFACIKVATAAQHQRLVDAIFEMTVGRLIRHELKTVRFRADRRKEVSRCDARRGPLRPDNRRGVRELEKSAASDPDANVNFMLVANSFAWHYVQYAPDNKELAGVEKTARELKLGLWADGGALNEIVSRRLVRQE